jgi:twitching motility protein PilT
MTATPDGKICDWLTAAVERGASDLHVVTGYPPTLRVHGRLIELPAPTITAEQARSELLPLCPLINRQQFERSHNTDFALQLPLSGTIRRFRVNYFLSGGDMNACFRIIETEIPTFEWAGFPRQLAEQLADFRNGLVLVCGVTGAGKTTSLAMIINLLIQQGGYRIITVEDPIEYRFPVIANSIVTQREVGHDVATFADGLKYGLRQDPDVILVGEIRDRDTAQMALSASETGHLVFSTLHTRDAKGAISRLIDFFPQTVQNEIRSQLSLSLRAVISQHLLPSAAQDAKRELAMEIMFNNVPIASGIRTGKIESIDTNIQTGRADGMVTLEESIRQLLRADRITLETANRLITKKR